MRRGCCCSPLPAGRTDLRSVLCCVSDLPSPALLSPEGGFLACSCQELLAVTSRCPSVQLLKTADGDVGCSRARPVALRAWYRISHASASSSIHAQSSHSLLLTPIELLVELLGAQREQLHQG